MAYSATITETREVIAGRLHITLEIVEADAAATSEWSWGDAVDEDLPRVGTITHYQATLATGTSTGTTIAPRLGKAAGWSDDTQDEITQSPTAAVAIHDVSLVRYAIPEGGRAAIYGRSTVDAGTDNDITTIITIVEGHLP